MLPRVRTREKMISGAEVADKPPVVWDRVFPTPIRNNLAEAAICKLARGWSQTTNMTLAWSRSRRNQSQGAMFLPAKPQVLLSLSNTETTSTVMTRPWLVTRFGWTNVNRLTLWMRAIKALTLSAILALQNLTRAQFGKGGKIGWHQCPHPLVVCYFPGWTTLVGRSITWYSKKIARYLT